MEMVAEIPLQIEYQSENLNSPGVGVKKCNVMEC